MVDPQKNMSSDDEYQFPQEEYVSSSQSTEQQTAAVEEAAADIKKTGIEKILAVLSDISPVLMRNKRIVIVIVVVFFAYLFQHFFMAKRQLTPVSAPSAQPTEQQTVTPAPIVQPSADNADLTGSLSSLQTSSSTDKTDIQALQTQVSNLQNAVSQAQTQNDQLRSTVDTMAAQMKTMSAQLNVLIAQGGAAKRGPSIRYHLRAVVPDRAWITSNTGETKTITLGDTIESYGKVVAIHPAQGIIETSSGRVIEYGSNDR